MQEASGLKQKLLGVNVDGLVVYRFRSRINNEDLVE